EPHPIPTRRSSDLSLEITKATRKNFYKISFRLKHHQVIPEVEVMEAVVEMEMVMVVETEMETVSLKIINNQFIIIMEKNIMTEQNYILQYLLISQRSNLV